MRLMERAGLPFAVFGYSSSVYGQTDAQFALLDRLASKCNARRTHHQIVRTLLSLACALVSVRDRHTCPSRIAPCCQLVSGDKSLTSRR